jgi:DNA-binding transcriptional regulator YiaG
MAKKATHALDPMEMGLWVPCDGCEEFFCTIHRRHAYECACRSAEMDRHLPTTRSGADHVRAIRAVLGENTATFGARFSVSGRTVEGWEQGRHKPTGLALKALERLAKRADVVAAGCGAARNTGDTMAASKGK